MKIDALLEFIDKTAPKNRHARVVHLQHLIYRLKDMLESARAEIKSEEIEALSRENKYEEAIRCMVASMHMRLSKYQDGLWDK